VKFEVKGAFYKLKKIREMILVGAPGFEPGASCAQANRVISWKSFLCNNIFENKGLAEKFGCVIQYENVAPHAQSPPNYSHSEGEAKRSKVAKFAFGDTGLSTAKELIGRIDRLGETSWC
jgi:hypothetical protein